MEGLGSVQENNKNASVLKLEIQRKAEKKKRHKRREKFRCDESAHCKRSCGWRALSRGAKEAENEKVMCCWPCWGNMFVQRGPVWEILWQTEDKLKLVRSGQQRINTLDQNEIKWHTSNLLGTWNKKNTEVIVVIAWTPLGVTWKKNMYV